MIALSIHQQIDSILRTLKLTGEAILLGHASDFQELQLQVGNLFSAVFQQSATFKENNRGQITIRLELIVEKLKRLEILIEENYRGTSTTTNSFAVSKSSHHPDTSDS